MSLKCHIVKDLLPNYIDHVTSQETNQDIQEHLKDCEDSKKIYDEMNYKITDQLIDLNQVNNNLKEINYLKEYKNTKILFFVLSYSCLLLLEYIQCFLLSLGICGCMIVRKRLMI